MQNIDKKSKSQDASSQFVNTEAGTTKSNAIEIPSISLPKGGGALKGIDEKFEVNSANGTAGFSIPLPVSPGRNGFSPSLSLSYNSGGGNSPYGLGWSVGYPMIQRKTDKRLPRYRDEDGFIFSGAEDLVPFLEIVDISGLERALQEKTNLGFNHASQIKKVLDFNPDYRQGADGPHIPNLLAITQSHD